MKRSRSRSQSSLGLVKYMLTPQEQTDDTYMNLRASTRIFHLLYTFSTSSTNLFMLLPKVRRWAPQELRTCARDYCNSFWMRCSSKLPPALGRSLLLAVGIDARLSLSQKLCNCQVHVNHPDLAHILHGRYHTLTGFHALLHRRAHAISTCSLWRP